MPHTSLLAPLLLAGLLPGAEPASPAATAALHALFPCAPGLAITYEVEDRAPAPGGAPAKLRFTDTIRGPAAAPGLCVVDRVRAQGGREVREAYARERLPDRVLHAGWADQPLALRPPLLKLPLEPGRRWTFDTRRYEILAVGAAVQVPAGRYAGAVEVRERAVDGGAEARAIYVPDVGRVRYETRSSIERAIRVERAPAGAASAVRR